MSSIPSLAKLFANKANAQKSTGPRTESGKAKVAQNATRHGLTAEGLVVADADRPEYEQMESKLRAEVDPRGALEETAFDHLLVHRWNIIRVRKAEKALLQQLNGADPLLNPDTAKQAELYMRYTQRFEGAYRSAFKHLEKLQTERGLRGHLECDPELPKTADVETMQRVAEQSHRVDCAPLRKELLMNEIVMRRSSATRSQFKSSQMGFMDPPSEAELQRFRDFCASHFAAEPDVEDIL
jgi:hypothetical protein